MPFIKPNYRQALEKSALPIPKPVELGTKVQVKVSLDQRPYGVSATVVKSLAPPPPSEKVLVTRHKKIVEPMATEVATIPERSNVSSVLFLNEIFERLAIVRILRKELLSVLKKKAPNWYKRRKPPGAPYAKDITGSDLMTVEEAAPMDRLLAKTEFVLRSAVPYKFSPDAVSSILSGDQPKISNDVSLPSPITWIDRCTEVSHFKHGALLVDEGKGIILITPFFNFYNSGFDQDAYIVSWESHRMAEVLSPIVRKVEAFGIHKENLVFVPTIIFDKEKNTFSFQEGENIFPQFSEYGSLGTIVYNYDLFLKNMKMETAQGIRDEILEIARKSLILAQAIKKHDPKIEVGEAIKPNPSNDILSVRMGRAPKRLGAVVTIDPTFLGKDRTIEEKESPAIEDVVATPNLVQQENPQTPAVFTSVTASEINSLPAEPTHSNPTLLPEILTEDEQAERKIKRAEAFEEAQSHLLADAFMYLTQAQSKGLNIFECRVGLGRPGFPIQLQFTWESGVEEERKIRKVSYALDQHSQAYAKRNVPLTMGDAVDLKIAVQSMICNTDGILSLHDSQASGQRTVELDTQMPLPVNDFKIVQSSNGMYSLRFDSRDPYTRKVINPSIPLGLAARHEDEQAEKCELENRADYVIDYLSQIESKCTSEGHKIYVTKRDVLMKLQAYLEEQNKEWAAAEFTELPNFKDNTLIYVSTQGIQKITLAPITLFMDAGGDNPSWHCNLTFYIGDKNKRPMGEYVRSRTLNLRTRNRALAIARTLETLLGVKSKSGNQIVEGFLPRLQNHMHVTQHEWRIENKGTPQEEAIIGDQPLQFFLDDMMRYERDIGIKITNRAPDEVGNIKITIQALRGLTGDYGGTVYPTPEYVYESEDNKRAPIAFTLTIDNAKSDEVDKFINDVQEHIRWHADEAYSSVALGTGGQADKRKKPLEYRTAQIRQSVIRGIEGLHEEYFGSKLPRKWHKPTAPVVLLQSPSNNEKAHHEQSPGVLFSSCERPPYHFHRQYNSRLHQC